MRFDVWVSRSYIRHQGQSLKRRVNLQTDIRGRGFSRTGTARRAGAAAPHPPHLSNLNGTDSSESSAKTGSLLGSLHTTIYETESRQFSSRVLKRRLTKVVCPLTAMKVLYVYTSKTAESVLQPEVNCFMALPICPCAFIFMAFKK